MRPRSLRLQAFGPFAGEVTIDFDDLASAGVFLIAGPTGAGKSSILDAICYALYGTVPGARDADGIRSQHAGASIETWVELDFTVAGDDWRVRRKPPQPRAKKRGSGTTAQRPEAVLLGRLPGAAEWDPRARGVDEVGAIVTELIGLDARQFQQVVLLPQGQYQEALRADPKSRRRLLSTLFDTGRFARVAEALHARARDASDALRSTDDRRRSLEEAAAGRWGEAFGTRRDGSPRELAVGAAREAEQTERERASCDATARLAGERERAGEQLADRHRRRDEARARRDALAARAPEVARAREEAARAAAVAPVVPLLDAADGAKRAVAEASAREQASRARATGVARHVPAPWGPVAGGDPATPDDLVETVGAAIARLDRARARAAEVRRLRDDASAAAARAAEAAAAGAALDEPLATGERRRAEITAERERATRAAAALDTRRAEAARAAEVETAARARPALEEAAAVAARRHDEAVARLDAIVERRIAGMAGELAAGLTPGARCPVCGSHEHPQPAASEGAVSEAALRSARDALARARVAADEARAASEAARARAGGTDVGSARVAGAAAAGALAQSERSVAEAERLDAELAALGAELDRRRTELGAHRDARQQADARAATLLEEGARGARELAEVCGPELTALEPGALAAALDRAAGALEDAAGTAASWREDARATADARAAEERDRVRLEAALAERALGSAEPVRMDRRDPARVAELQELVREHEVSSAATTRELAAPELADLPPPPDLEALREDASRARAALERAGAAATRARDAAAFLDTAARRHASLVSEGERAARDAARRRDLADDCGGTGNERRMSLEAYVLAARLEEIAAAASHRLRAMSEGRFTLRHSDERRKGGGASGLSLVVQDAHTGAERDVGTLSGGETFLASLALALGVADVVQRERGGVELQALFVDEGFGSLDADALDDALAELDHLRAGGRMVGVISHVESMRDRIPAGIVVTPGPRGSRAALADPAAR